MRGGVSGNGDRASASQAGAGGSGREVREGGWGRLPGWEVARGRRAVELVALCSCDPVPMPTINCKASLEQSFLCFFPFSTKIRMKLWKVWKQKR